MTTSTRCRYALPLGYRSFTETDEGIGLLKNIFYCREITFHTRMLSEEVAYVGISRDIGGGTKDGGTYSGKTGSRHNLIESGTIEFISIGLSEIIIELSA